MKKEAMIVGAGLVGALWAVFLAKRGYKVEVFERRKDMRRAGFVGGKSINLAMSERGWKALEKAGIADKLRNVAIPMRQRMMHGLDGELTPQAYGTADQAIYSVSRGGLNLELINIADSFSNVNFHFNQRCRGIDFETNTVRFEDLESGEITTQKSELIFGTDGAFSAVRGSMMKTHRFNYAQEYLDYGYKELSIPPVSGALHAMDANSLHIWPRGKFMLIALPNVDGTFTCTLFLPYEGGDSFEHLRTDEQIIAFFKKYFPDVIPMMPDLLADFHENPIGSLVTVRCNPWQYAGKALLLGDAAHAIVPFFGQGMNAGFEDCTILDELTDEYQENWPEIFSKFSDTRIKDGNAIADLALRNFIEMRDLVADPRFLLRKQIAAWLHEKYPDFLPVYSMVSFSHLPYSMALEASVRQDALFEKILSLPGIEQDWKSPEVEKIFLNWRVGAN